MSVADELRARTPGQPVQASPWRTVLRCDVPGEPVSKDRPRFMLRADGRPHVYTSKKTTAAEKRIREYAWAAGCRSEPIADACMSVHLHFYVKRLGSRDTDNLTKLVLDALNGVAWHDDRQVVHLDVLQVGPSPTPRTEITVYQTGWTFSAPAPRTPAKPMRWRGR